MSLGKSVVGGEEYVQNLEANQRQLAKDPRLLLRRLCTQAGEWCQISYKPLSAIPGHPLAQPLLWKCEKV